MHLWWGCGSVEHQTSMPPTQFQFRNAARDFSPRVNFQCRLSYFVCTHPCAFTCINICAHVKDPVGRVKVWWIMERLKHPACTVGRVAWLCRGLCRGKQPKFPMKEIQMGQYSCYFFFLSEWHKGSLIHGHTLKVKVSMPQAVHPLKPVKVDVKHCHTPVRAPHSTRHFL